MPLAKDLRTFYTAAAALQTFDDRRGERYPAIVKLWRAHWSEFTPFLAFPPEIRRVIYTTDEMSTVVVLVRVFAGMAGPPQPPDLAVRIATAAGDPFAPDPYPAGHDIALLSLIMHSFTPARTGRSWPRPSTACPAADSW